MRILKSVCVLSLGGYFGLVACSSGKGADGNTGQNPAYNPNANKNSPTGGLVAQNTDTGLSPPITAAVAATLTNPNDPATCTGGGAEPEGGSPPVMEFVIDASGSMGTDPANPAQPNGPKKWDVFSQTMPGVFASLPANFAIGVTYYNKANGNARYVGAQAVPIGPHTAAQQTLIANSIANTTPGGYTPTYNAWEFGLQQLTQWQAPAAYATSPRYIVLITDGVPTVLHDGRTIENPISQAEYNAIINGGTGSAGGAQIAGIKADGLAANVKTFVVGVVGSENPQNATYDPLYMLSQLAVAGGTAPTGCVPVSGTPAGDTVNPRGTYCHFDLSQAADFGAALSSTLGGIAQSVISCDYTVPTPSTGQIDPNTAVLVYNDGAGNYSLVLPNTTAGITAATCDKGYIFTDAASTQLHICSSTCTALQKNPAASLEFRFGCTNGPIIN
jgi:hypothetical protein